MPALLQTNFSLHRLEFRFARVVTAVILLIYAAAVLPALHVSGAVASIIIIQNFISADITLVANYSMERDLRCAGPG
ncbi:hypothetical protein JQ596_23905 [Bradyrhizobium manausense]|uniref:hypothetical protein n=1 Tax=Bradyrhizobium manausense TaxID=989370 RepID=UPI001BA69FCF|nr:hypothetical protein [Bradyrhizobium manausense]MBR0828585.1 hypothetical protein [Bradyrhizobium manausense]